MALADAMREIEQLRFAVRVGLANSFRAFLRNISDEESVKELLVLLKSRNVGLQILERVLSISKLRVDFRYLYPFDICLATYLWVLSRSFPDLARAGAEVTANLPRTWWTQQVTDYILQEWGQKSVTVTSTGAMSAKVAGVNTSNVAASTSVFFSGTAADFVPTKEHTQFKLENNETSSGATEAIIVPAENVAPLRYTVGTKLSV